MNPVLRNLLSVARRFKLAATLNILGLSVAFAAFMIIMIQLDYDYGFDKFHKGYDKIFRVEFSNKTTTQAVISRPLAEQFFESSPHIVAGAISNPWGWEVSFYVENNGERNFFKEKGIGVSPEFTDVFTFDFVEGEKDALKSPGKMLIPLSLSRKLFGKESAIDKQLFTGSEKSPVVGAVYRDFPANSVVNNYLYYAIPAEENKQNKGNWNYHVYIRVNQASNAKLLFDNFKRNFDVKLAFGDNFNWDESGSGIRLTALPDIHFVTDVQYDQRV